MKAFKFKLYFSKHNRKLSRQIDVASTIYNHCIALHKRYYRLFKKHLEKNKLQKHLTKLKKKNRFYFWNELNSQTIQDITDRIDRAYKLFFRNLKHHIKTTPPSFKKRVKYKSYTLKQCGYKYSGGNKVKIGKRTYKFFHSRDIEGDIKTVTIKRDSAGDFYIIFICDGEHQLQVDSRTGHAVGFDFGLKRLLTGADEKDNKDTIESPLFLFQNSKKYKAACRKFSRKQKGSNHKRRARIELAKLYRRIVHTRDDFQWKLALQLVRQYDIICLEDLNIKGMQRLYGRKISDLAFSSFVNKLLWQAEKYHKIVVFVDRYYASSQICSNCGDRNHILIDLGIRDWICPKCLTHHDRDFNAAKNILREGLRILRERGIVLYGENLSDSSNAA